MINSQHGRVKQTVKGGVVAEQVQAKGRSADNLKDLVREMVESGIVRLHEAYKKEHLTGPDVDLLQRYVRLLNELGMKVPDDPNKPVPGMAEMSEEDLAKAAK